MRKTTEYKAENRLTVDIEGLMAMLSCGEVTAKKIADYAEARVIVGRRVLYNVDKIKKCLVCRVMWRSVDVVDSSSIQSMGVRSCRRE